MSIPDYVISKPRFSITGDSEEKIQEFGSSREILAQYVQALSSTIKASFISSQSASEENIFITDYPGTTGTSGNEYLYQVNRYLRNESSERSFNFLTTQIFNSIYDYINNRFDSSVISGARVLELSISYLFKAGKEERFEDGKESNFSRSLVSFIYEYEISALEIIGDLILNKKVEAEPASEALRWLGLIEHSATYFYRLTLLEQALSSSSPQIRDGAALGLAFMDDPSAINPLKSAIKREKIELLKQNLNQVLVQLETTYASRVKAS
jgi:hypothetical protein